MPDPRDRPRAPDPMTGAAVYFILGLSLLLATVLPQVTRRIAISPPMVLVAVGMGVGMLPLFDGVSLEPQDHHDLITHVTEFTVLVALMGVGLAIDRELDLRSWRSWRTWSPVWRLLLVTMPLTILGVAVLGWWVAGLAPAVALLLGAVLAPDGPRAGLGRPGRRAAHRRRRRPRRRGGARGGRRHPVRADRRGRAQRRAGLPLRAPRAADAGRRLHAGGRCRRGWGGTSWARSPSVSRSASLPGGCWDDRRSTPAPTSSGWPTTASPCWRWPRCWRRTARRSWSAATASWRSSPARCGCAPPSAGTPTSARCTAWSSGSSG